MSPTSEQGVEPAELPWLRLRYAEIAAVADPPTATLLAEIASAELTAPGHEELVQRVVEAIAAEPWAEAVLLVEPSGDGRQWAIGAAAGEATVSGGEAIGPRRPGESPAWEPELALGEPLLPGGGQPAQALLGPGTRSARAAWIPGFDEPAATLVIGSGEHGGAPPTIVEAAAVALGLAIQRRGQEERLRALSSSLQHGLMPPRRLVMPGLEFAARLITPGTGVLVGGDFCDVFRTGDGGWAFLIGDISGHGFELATATALARYTVRVTALEDSQPARVLSVLNQAIERFGPAEQYCTAAYLKIPAADDDQRPCLGIIGHPPPLHARAGGAVEVLEPQPGLLGVEGELRPEEVPLEVAPGDVFVLYTDGVTDAGRGWTGNGLGLDGLKEIVVEGARRGEGAEALVAAIEQAVITAMAGEPNDDAAVVVVRVTE